MGKFIDLGGYVAWRQYTFFAIKVQSTSNFCRNGLRAGRKGNSGAIYDRSIFEHKFAIVAVDDDDDDND